MFKIISRLKFQAEEFGKLIEFNNPKDFIKQLIKFVKNPISIDKKEDAYLLKFIFEGDLKTFIVLDYDGGVSIDEFTEKFKDIAWILHTSFNHTSEYPKFHVYMPLSTPLKSSYILNAMKGYAKVSNFFLNTDKKCFGDQLMYEPSRGKEYFYKINHGKPLDTSIDSDLIININKYLDDYNTFLKTSAFTADSSVPIYPQSYYDKILDNLERDILKTDINNRGNNNNISYKIYYFVKTAENGLLDINKAKDFVLKFAKNPETIRNINNIK